MRVPSSDRKSSQVVRAKILYPASIAAPSNQRCRFQAVRSLGRLALPTSKVYHVRRQAVTDCPSAIGVDRAIQLGNVLNHLATMAFRISAVAYMNGRSVVRLQGSRYFPIT